MMRRTHICTVTGAEEVHQCAHVGPFNYTIDQCPCGQVIDIRSAVFGFSPEWNADEYPRRCPLMDATCIRIIDNSDAAIRNCQRRSSCWISINNYALSYFFSCDGHRYGNFINIIYDCVKPGKIKYCFINWTFGPKIFCLQLNYDECQQGFI